MIAFSSSQALCFDAPGVTIPLNDYRYSLESDARTCRKQREAGNGAAGFQTSCSWEILRFYFEADRLVPEFLFLLEPFNVHSLQYDINPELTIREIHDEDQADRFHAVL